MSFFDGQIIYLNKDVKLKKGGRKAVCITEEEFDEIISKLKNKAEKLGYCVDCTYGGKYAWIASSAFYEVFSKARLDVSKIDFDFENFEIDDTIFVTSQGVPYLQCLAGGDWEIPIRFFIYYDGKTMRGYVPTKGNPFNRKAKSAIGNTDEGKNNDNVFILKELFSNVPEYDDDEFEEDLFDNWDLIEIQDNWCLEDFESRLEV